jgi:hypothetical protein
MRRPSATPGRPSFNDREKLTREANAAVDGALEAGEPVRLVIRGVFGSALVATDRRVLLWKQDRLVEFPWQNLTSVAFGGRLVRWVQLRGPSIGLSKPSLLNVGRLSDTIQVGELVEDDARSVLELMVAQRGQGQAVELDEAPAKQRSAPGSPAKRAARPLLEAEGAGGRVALFPDRIRIQHHGFRGVLRKALPDEKEIALTEIASVDWRAPGPLRIGHLRIYIRRGSTRDVADFGPENEVMFYLHQEPAFRRIQVEIERRIARHGRQAQPTAPKGKNR